MMKKKTKIEKGMAKDQKTHNTPSIIEAPQSLVPLMQAFHVDSDAVARSLISEATQAIYGKIAEPESDFDFEKKKRVISKSELDGVISLMKCIQPRDSLETLFAAQIVASHMLGMRKLSELLLEDQKLGLNLLRFSKEAMQQLAKKRGGGTQNITVNYNYNGQVKPRTQTVLAKGKHQCQSEE